MKQAGRFTSALILLVALAFVPATLADNGQLKKAGDLFKSQQYAAAQELLLKIHRSDLTGDELKRYDELLKKLPEAIRRNKEAQQVLAAADKAFQEGRWQQAELEYSRVIGNPYAPAAARQRASIQRQRAKEKLSLLAAGKQKHASSGSVQVTTPAAKPAPAKPVTPPPAKPAPASTPKPHAKSPAAPPRMAAPPPAPTGPRRRTLVDDLRSRDELLWQRAVAKMQDAVKKAGEAVADERFDEATELAESAVQVIEANRIYAEPPSKYQAARKIALEAKKSVEKAKAEYDLRAAAEQREAIAKQIEQRRASQEKQKREKIEQLFSTAQQLQKEQRYNEAAEAMRTVLAIDPANAKASFWLDTYEDFASYLSQKRVDRDIRRETRRILEQADESRIPWGHDILYPKNWIEIVTRREGIENTVGPEQDFELNRILDSTQEEVDFEEQPFDQVIDTLTDLNDLNIAVDWEDLERSGIDRDKPVSLKLKNVTLRTVLNEVLSQIGGDVPVRFAIGQGLVRIATKEKLDRDKYTLVYDIRDLIVNIPHFANAPLIDLKAMQNGTGGESLSPSGRDALFGSGGRGDDSPGPEQDNASKRIVKQIMDLIRTTVEPDSWRETGGGDGALRELNGQLIVYNTSQAHEQTRSLLDQLRDARALMIAVESRFLLVSSNFLEELGVDLDFVFNAGSASYDPAFVTGPSGGPAPLTDPFTGAQVLVPRQFSRAGVIPALPAVGTPLAQNTPLQPYGNAAFVPGGTGIIPQLNNMSPITAQQGSLALADPRTLNTGIPGSFATQGLTPALNIAGSFLDNLQVDFLIRATQANRRSSIVQAPRLMLFNGQRAYVSVTRNRQYVSSVTPQVAEGAVGVQPVTQNALSGATLDVDGTISADRKYVTITVRTDRATEPTFERFEVQRASGNSPGIFILLPDQEQTVIRTTVSVPDGGTVLLGGLKQVGEVEIEAGVPILSKIPILKRAFTNTTQVKDTQTLLILLKAKILIQKEAEEEAFPTLSAVQPG